MRRLLVLGAGTAGTMVANKLRRRLAARSGRSRWSTRDDVHLYQPGCCSCRSARTGPSEMVKPRRRFMPDGVELVVGEIDRVDADGEHGARSPTAERWPTTTWSSRPARRRGRTRRRACSRRPVAQEHLRLLHPRRRDRAGARRWRTFDGGRLVVHIVDMPIKCPVAPLEFAFLADAYFRERGHARPGRDRLRHPAAGAFTKPIASAPARRRCWTSARSPSRRTSWSSASTPSAKTLVSYDEREIPFDLLVTVPLNMGADYRRPLRAGRRAQLRAGRQAHPAVQGHDNIFALGDANDIPASKAGSVAHFSVEVFVDNFLAARRRASR